MRGTDWEPCLTHWEWDAPISRQTNKQIKKIFLSLLLTSECVQVCTLQSCFGIDIETREFYKCLWRQFKPRIKMDLYDIPIFRVVYYSYCCLFYFFAVSTTIVSRLEPKWFPNKNQRLVDDNTFSFSRSFFRFLLRNSTLNWLGHLNSLK